MPDETGTTTTGGSLAPVSTIDRQPSYRGRTSMDPNNTVHSESSRTAMLGQRPLRITAHAIARYQQRVDSRASGAAAVEAIAAMVAAGCVRANPRRWTDVALVPGTKLVYSAIQPDACLVVRDQAVVTVITRELCARRRRVPTDARRPKANQPGLRRIHEYETDWRQEVLAA
jgi:hypothetical protein